MKNILYLLFILLVVITSCKDTPKSETKGKFESRDTLEGKNNVNSLNKPDFRGNINDQFDFIADSLDLFLSENYFIYYKKFLKLNSRLKNCNDENVIRKVEGSKQFAINILPNKYTEVISFYNMYFDSINDTYFQSQVYHRLIKTASYEGKLKESLKFDSLLNLKYPSYRPEYHKKNMQEIAKYNKIIENLYASNIPEDQLLWELGNAYFNLFLIDGPTIEGCVFNMEFPFSFFKKLIKKYPKSIFTEQAEYKILNFDVGASREGGDRSSNLNSIEAYLKHINKYPKTKNLPDAYYRIGELYYDYLWASEDQLKYCELSKIYLNKVINDFNDYEQIDAVKDLYKQADLCASRIQLVFEIESNKKEYLRKEPIVITYKIVNKADRDKPFKINCNKKISNFSLEVQYSPILFSDSGFKVINLTDKTSIDYNNLCDTIIPPKGNYIEKWNINENARIMFSSGRYDLTDVGEYCLFAEIADDGFSFKIKSNKIFIKVINK